MLAEWLERHGSSLKSHSWNARDLQASYDVLHMPAQATHPKPEWLCFSRRDAILSLLHPSVRPSVRPPVHPSIHRLSP